jgi:D-glycero-alpha-D-manno-heptose-7-phosphate kinase
MKRRILNAAAPIRICDIGGWTDTWFAGHGTIFNIAVYPYVEVQIHLVDAAELESRVVINLENFNERFAVDPKQLAYDKHPLIEAALDVMAIPEDVSFEVNIFSTAPPGASTGTSAAVSVALIGALDSLTSGRLSPHEVAMLAHSLETEKLGLQCGIQDQLCSAYGGINFIQMHAFPHASVSPVLVPNSIWWELEQRLAVVYIGTPHSSNEVHKMVIAGMGANASSDPRLEELRRLASQAKNAIYTGDFSLLGDTMNRNTDVQRAMHKDLVCPKFEEIISVSKSFGVLGCKVNGAGGDGGSVTILCGDVSQVKRTMIREIEQENALCKNIPLYLSRYGLRVWKQACP